MSKSKAGANDRKVKKQLRRSWIEEHPDVRAARGAIEQAQKLAEQPKWVADPAVYCSSARDATERAKNAKQGLKDVIERVKSEFNRAVGLEGGDASA